MIPVSNSSCSKINENQFKPITVRNNKRLGSGSVPVPNKRLGFALLYLFCNSTLHSTSMNNTEPEDSERADGRRQRIERDGNRYQNNLKQVWVLPDDITLEIFCKLPIKTLTRCRCVCKSWRHTLSDSVFTQSLLSRPPACLFLDDRCRRDL